MPRITTLEAGQVWMDIHARVHCAECGRGGMVKPRPVKAEGYACKCDKCGGYTAPVIHERVTWPALGGLTWPVLGGE